METDPAKIKARAYDWWLEMGNEFGVGLIRIHAYREPTNMLRLAGYSWHEEAGNLSSCFELVSFSFSVACARSLLAIGWLLIAICLFNGG